MPPPGERKTSPLLWPLAAALAWVLPGLGHWFIGERLRGAIVGGTLLALFFGGMIIGGLDVIDYRRDRIWFAGQAFIGPIALGANLLHIKLDPPRIVRQEDVEGTNRQVQRTIIEYPVPRAPTAGYEPKYYPSIGRMNELGTLYCTLAGVLNLLAILDVVGRLTHVPSEDDLPTTPVRGKLLKREEA